MPDDVIQLPLVDGGEGSIEHLVTLTLGSFLEVEATDATGKQAILPLGFLGESNATAVIEMKTVAGVGSFGQAGTTYGIGELIQDALDESAFSVILGLDEPIARDYGLGAAAALGVKFFGKGEKELDLRKPIKDLISKIERIDVSGRSFQTLASRFYVAKTKEASANADSDLLLEADLERLNKIMRRDLGTDFSLDGSQVTCSGVEVGLKAFLNAEIKDGGELMLEAGNIGSLFSEQPATLLLVLNSPEDLQRKSLVLKELLALAQKCSVPVIKVFSTKKERSRITRDGSNFVLSEVQVFSAPLDEFSSSSDRRRDFQMRLEKIIPQILESHRTFEPV